MGNSIVSAVDDNRVDEVERLLQSGSVPNACDDQGEPLLVKACRNGFKDVVDVLLKRGAVVNKANRNGETALMTSAISGSYEIIIMLLQAGADINQTNLAGATALHYAAYKNHSNIVSLLLANGCDVNAVSGRGTALEIAEIRNNRRVVDTISSFVAPLTRTRTPLQQSPNEELVKQLLQQIELLRGGSATKDREITRQRQQITDLEKALRDEQLQREREQTGKEERRENKKKEHLQQLLTEEQRRMANIEELLSDAEAAVERNNQRKESEVLNISSHDIRLTDTELGRGSYGVVCVGYWRGCPVAVKRLYDDLAAAPRYVHLLQQEVFVAWRLHHPNIAAVCGVTLELEEKKAWIVMELQSGSMSGVIDACHGDVSSLTLREKVDMAHDTLCGLDYIHSMQPREILHGDICPRNILVTAMMRAKLGDLGAARFRDASLSVGLVSPQYTAPERLDVPAQPKSTKTDMYSMAVTICELFTFVPPDREQRKDQVLLIRQRDVRSLCKHLMSDDPATRPTAAEARDVVSQICETDEYTACSPRRMVIGKMDGISEVALVQPHLVKPMCL
ncbi:probable serine/threonine-protein kinase DDB_G0281745 [Corticium candelabrum]|uniref:probable serine/threonine-protein kinase DDB_G0281745 n=1 Tax=Corticium candelabrum TaxID=121492 RepID=UPI002E273806|nr:probable serine/threonine-protein kinase DDB_G0281745 [Corticium candelabrum]